MPNRITKVTTRTGDDGTTGLADGSRISKTSCRIECIGEIDELNSLLGLVNSYNPVEPVQELIREIQNTLFTIGGELASPGISYIKIEDVTLMERLIEDYNRELPPLKEFILPGGSHAASVCHLARAVCRRCERHLVQLAESEAEAVNPGTPIYINRLSDLLFILSRHLARADGREEIYWRKQK